MTDTIDVNYQINKQKIILAWDISIGKTSIINVLLNLKRKKFFSPSIDIIDCETELIKQIFPILNKPFIIGLFKSILFSIIELSRYLFKQKNIVFEKVFKRLDSDKEWKISKNNIELYGISIISKLNVIIIKLIIIFICIII